MSQSLKGTFFTVTAAICWGLSGVSGQYLIHHGVDVNLLTTLRLIVSGTLLCTYLLFTKKEAVLTLLKQPKILLHLILFSIGGLVLNQFAYLKAIQFTNAGTATVIQYLTPILILIYLCLKDRVLPSLIEVISITLAIFGTFIMATHGNLGNLAITPKGLFWGIFSAFTYCAYILLSATLIKKFGSLPVIGLAMLIGGGLFTISTQSWQYNPQLNPQNLLAYFGIIVIGTLLAYTLFLKGVTLVGPIRGSLLASIEPIAAVFFTIILLHEHFFLIDILGMVCILTAVILISIRDLIRDKSHQ